MLGIPTERCYPVGAESGNRHDGLVITLLRYRQPDAAVLGEPEWRPRLTAVLDAVAGSAGFSGGWIGRNPDDPREWLVAVHWVDAGSMRRGLGGFEAKLALGPLEGFAAPGAGVFEILQSDEDGRRTVVRSERAADADSSGPG